jgi:steroid 5-alpha reductase family enzyme
MLTALPVLILSTKGTKPPSFPQPLDMLGLSVWILGFATEVGSNFDTIQ